MTTDEFTREYSKRLGTLTGAQLQAALDHFDLGRLQKTDVPRDGLFGMNVFLTTDKGEYVFHGAHFGFGCLGKERFMAEQLAEHTRAPVPWPFLHETSTEIFGWDWAIMPRMMGLDPHNPDRAGDFSSEDRREIARAVGATAAELYKFTWPKFGDYWAGRDEVLADEPTFAEWTLKKLRAKIVAAREVSPERNPDDEVAWLEELISKYEPALSPPPEPTYVHHDYREGNLVVDRDECGQWRVSGVFDLSEGYFGDGEEDLPRAFSWYAGHSPERAEAFVAGYAGSRPLRPGAVERFALYWLSDHMTFWSYGLEHNWHKDQRTLREYVSEHFQTRLEQFRSASSRFLKEG